MSSRDPSSRRRRDDHLVRPYLLTRGRTDVPDLDLHLETLVVASEDEPEAELTESEQVGLVESCREPAAVVDLAAALRLPVGVVRVIIGDLASAGHIVVYDDPVEADIELVRRLMDGVRDL